MEHRISVLSSCDQKMSAGNCAQVIPQTRNGVCECINEARDDLKKRIASIAGVFQDVSHNTNRLCISEITSVRSHSIDTPVLSWKSSKTLHTFPKLTPTNLARFWQPWPRRWNYQQGWHLCRTHQKADVRAFPVWLLTLFPKIFI